ncbi:MAG: hypothetical protein HY816_09040 [Candidatus Wallbacteria bacterium]|nr:hypothetical protein [Candidatus Wallbacteria bacterium]
MLVIVFAAAGGACWAQEQSAEAPEVREILEARESGQAQASTTATSAVTEDSGLLDEVAEGAKGFGRRAGRFLGRVAASVGDGARRAGRSVGRNARKLANRLSHRQVDLTKPGVPSNLALVIPGTDLGVRVLKQIDRYGHYDPAWAHAPSFIGSIQKRWPDSQVKLFTWLSGPDPITIDAAASGLYHFIRQWRAEHPRKLVRIYAHSNGGNVALHAAARHKPGPGESPIFIDELITAGTPLKPDDEMSTRFGAIAKIVFVFTRNDWVAGDVRGSSMAHRDPRMGVVPKILGSGHTPELAVMAKMFKSAPVQSPTTHQYVVSLDATTATTRTVDQTLRETYGQDFFERREAGTIGEVDASDIAAGHSDYNRPEVNVAILERVTAFDRGQFPDAALAPMTPTTGAAPK